MLQSHVLSLHPQAGGGTTIPATSPLASPCDPPQPAGSRDCWPEAEPRSARPGPRAGRRTPAAVGFVALPVRGKELKTVPANGRCQEQRPGWARAGQPLASESASTPIPRAVHKGLKGDRGPPRLCRWHLSSEILDAVRSADLQPVTAPCWGHKDLIS